jgi:hypothetical protein
MLHHTICPPADLSPICGSTAHHSDHTGAMMDISISPVHTPCTPEYITPTHVGELTSTFPRARTTTNPPTYPRTYIFLTHAHTFSHTCQLSHLMRAPTVTLPHRCSPPQSCRDLIENYNASAPSGVYTVRPDPAAPAFQVYCENDFYGGGKCWSFTTTQTWKSTSPTDPSPPTHTHTGHTTTTSTTSTANIRYRHHAHVINL